MAAKSETGHTMTLSTHDRLALVSGLLHSEKRVEAVERPFLLAVTG